MSTIEANYDGLIGPTHNYGGLSEGNLASQNNAEGVSKPRAAALQGLDKMKLLHDMGFIQGILPPQERPCFPTLQALGFRGSDQKIWRDISGKAPVLARNMIAASPMWAANAATLSPSLDTPDHSLHMTPANLLTMLHRSIEHPQTEKTLKRAFPDSKFFKIHGALPQHPAFADEGAANHVRLCRTYGELGIEIFVYGQSHFLSGRQASSQEEGLRLPARQTLEASEAIARRHGLSDKHTLFIEQSTEVINAGAFHNDVVCVGNQTCFFYHEKAFQNKKNMVESIRKAASDLFEPCFIEVPEAKVSLENAISSYLFNSQLLVRPGFEQEYILIAPIEVQENKQTRIYCENLTSGNGPIREIKYVDVRQSMRNGGGPACLRLRVVLTDEERKAVNENLLLSDTLYQTLQKWVNQYYREELHPEDLFDPLLLDETRLALSELTNILSLGSDFYSFQQR